MARLLWILLSRWSLLSVLLLPAISHATNRYAAPNGTGSTCSEALPCALTTLAGQLVAGDIGYLRGGTYAMSLRVTLSANGSSDSRITLTNYPGETPMLDGASMTGVAEMAIRLLGSYWTISGLEILNAARDGIEIGTGASHAIVERCNIHHNVRLNGHGAGIHIHPGAGEHHQLLNNDVHHQSLDMAGSTGGDGILWTQAPYGAHSVARGNRVWRNNDDGIDLWGAKTVLVEYNWSWENGFNDALQKSDGNGAGIKGGGSDSGEGNHTIRYNVIWNNGEDGINSNQADFPMTIVHNTFWGNNRPGMFGINLWNDVVHIARNNLVGNPNDVNLHPNVVHDHNSWDSSPTITITAADFVTTDFTANLGPRQADGSLPASQFLHLVAGSDARNTGVDLGFPYGGSAPDLGAYAFLPSAPVMLRLGRTP